MTPQGPTWEYLHLIAVLFPVALGVSGTLVGLAGWVIGREALERWGVVSLLLAGLAAVPAFVTGLSAADVAATRTFVRPSAIQTHRSWATWTAVVLVAQAAFAAFALYQPGDRRLRRFVLTIALLGAGLLGVTAFEGGKIVHGPATDAERIRERAAARSPFEGGGEASAQPTIDTATTPDMYSDTDTSRDTENP